MRPPKLPGSLPEVTTSASLGGGDIGQTWRAQLADGRAVVIKQSPTDATLEAEGLAALRDAGGAVPQVHAATTDGLLVLEAVDSSGDPADFGRMLAAVHRSRAAAYGWHRDNVIGSLPQANPWTSSWLSFFTAHRILGHLDGIDASVAARLRQVVDDGRLAAEIDHDVTPSLLHGDLWSGNVLGWRWLIDPAVYYGDREIDLAMLDLFGTIPSSMLAGYEDVWPLDAGWQRRRPILQLPPLLVHVRLFGAGYLPGVVARLDALGW